MAATAFTFTDELQQQSRFSDRDIPDWTQPRQEPKPNQKDPLGHTCPYCDQQLPDPGTTIVSMFGGGLRRLLVAVLMITVAGLRCIRFVAAGGLCMIGLFGACCRAIGLRIAHPHDRRLLSPRRINRRG